MSTQPTSKQVAAAWRHLSRSDRTRLEMWIYGRALAGQSSDEISEQLNRAHRWRPERASRWSAEMVRQRLRYARRSMRRALRLPDLREYSGTMRPEQAREHRRLYRALRAEAARLDGMMLAAGVVR